MRTMHPVLKRGGLFWDRDLLPPDAYLERFRRMQATIADAGDDAWLVYGDVERHGALTYVSNFLPRTRSAVAFLPRKGDAVLLASVGLRDIPAAKALTWIEDVRPFLQLPKVLIALLEEKGLSKGKLGLIGADESMPITEWSAIESGLPGISWSTRSEILSDLQQRKDTFELATIRRTASMVETALDEAPRVLRPGATMRQVAAQLDRDIRRKGAEDVRVLVASGDQVGTALRPPDDRALRAGDIVMLFIAAEFQRYWAEAARTYVLGPPPKALQDLARRVAAAVSAMREGAAAGVPVAQLARLADEALGDAALRASVATYGLGHGIGLDEDEAPVIAPGVEQRLSENSTLALHLIAHSGTLGVALGQTIVTRKDRGESLNDVPALVECRIG